MLSQQKCMIDGHEEQQIIGICEYVNCTSQRKVCLACIQMHQHNDKSFKMSDIKNDLGIQKMLTEFKENNISKINNIYIQCYIQQYFQSIKMIEYAQQAMLQYQQLANIINDLDKFEKETWKKLNIANYLENHNIGAQTYLQQILSKLEKIDQQKDDYLLKINDMPIDQRLQVLSKSDQSKIIDQFIESLKKNNDNVLQKIISNDLYKKESVNENPSESIHKIIQQQDQILQSNILREQYETINTLITNEGNKFLLKIKEDTQKAQQNKEKSIQLYEEANKLHNQEKYNESLEIFDQAIKLDPQNARAYQNKAHSFNKLKRYQEAIEMWDQVIKLDPNYVYAYNTKGNQLYYLQRYEEAIIMYQQTNQIDPKYFYGYYNKGDALNKLKRYNEAIEMLDLAIKLDDEHANTYHQKGESFQNLQRYQEAIVLYEQAIKLDPKNVQAYINKGISLNNVRRYQEGIEMFDQAIKLGSKNAILYYNKGNSLYYLKRYLEAIQVYEEAIKLDPQNVDAYLQKGISLSDLQRYQQAIEMYDKVIKLDNKRAIAYHNKGTSLQNLERYKESIEMFDQAIKLDPQYKHAFKGFTLSLVKNLENTEFIKNSLIALFCLFIFIIVVMKLI